MKCQICERDFKNLGVHVQKKHMSCDDYRRKFDIPLSAPLADAYLCELLSVSARQRLEDPIWLGKCRTACEFNSKQAVGTTKKLNLPAISKKRLIAMNRETSESYRKKMLLVITPDYLAGVTPAEIKRKHGIAAATLRDWQQLGLLPRRLLKYVFNSK